jgi:hypothetical protein
VGHFAGGNPRPRDVLQVTVLGSRTLGFNCSSVRADRRGR